MVLIIAFRLVFVMQLQTKRESDFFAKHASKFSCICCKARELYPVLEFVTIRFKSM